MKKLSEVFPPDQVVKCECGSAAFFDWGIQLAKTLDYPGPRSKEWTNNDNVKICASCLKPVVFYDGNLYDASEYIKPEQIEEIIQRGQSREHGVPVKAMDP